MKFHGVSMVGPFTNQKMVELPDPWVEARDQGRLVWLTNGTLWYGSDVEFVNFASSSGDASEVEDMYSDLLRTTIFMNASYDGFTEVEPLEDLVASTDMYYNEKETQYEYTSGQFIESENLFDGMTGLEFVDYFMVYCDFIEPGNGTQVIEVTTNDGVDWTTVDMLKTIKIPNTQAGTDVRMRFTGSGNGTLYSWGILYNKDLSAACTRWGLTYSNFEAEFDGQDTFELTYTPKAIQVFLNGGLLDVTDYVADDGMTVVFETTLDEGDIVYIVSYSTSILDPNFDESELIHSNGSVIFTNEQSMGDNKLTDVNDGVLPKDAINLSQLDAAIGGVDLSTLINEDGSVVFINNQSMGSHRITNLSDGLQPQDAVAVSQLQQLENTFVLDQSNQNNTINMNTQKADQNISDISSMSSTVTLNGNNITSLTDRVSQNELDVSGISTTVTTHTNSIASLESRVAQNEADILALQNA